MREVEDAARRVQVAMRALDAYRHGAAPTLEREYTRALEEYYATAERALGRDPATEADDDELTDAAVLSAGETLRAERYSIEGHFAAARRALRLARVYRAEPESSGRRERECIAVVQRHREAIRTLRMKMRPDAEQLLLPGLAKTRPLPVETRRLSKTG